MATENWYFRAGILFAACFGVFVLPLLLPPPYLAGVSAANVAGFNNKICSLAAAALGTFVCLAALLWPVKNLPQHDGNFGKLPWPIVMATVLICGCMVALLTYLVAMSGQDYGDGRYFIRQISMHIDYGRQLYNQVELPYGPLLFCGPVMVHSLLSPLHASTTTAYYATLLLEQVAGLLLVVWVLNHLPILRRWKMVFLLLCLVHTYPFGFGLNYTFVRFALPTAFLVLAARQTKPWTLAASLFAGQAASLALSPEMGFAFAASSIAYATYCLFTAGKRWLPAVFAPFAATPAFLLVAGGGYLRMLKLFARGIANFVVEPMPYILVFLFALIWMVPLMLARSFGERRAEAPLLAALYVFSVALVPVALGRADPGHVFFSGFGIYLLSLVAVSELRPFQQVAWMTCVVLIVTWTAFVDDRFYWPVLRARIRYDAAHWQDDRLMRAAHAITQKISPAAEVALFPVAASDHLEFGRFDLGALQALVGHDPVVLPLTLPLPVENAIRRSGQFVPTFFSCEWSVLDASAEDRQLRELNASRWTLMPRGPIAMFTETQQSVAPYLGHRLPYHSPYPVRREPYVIGRRFAENLQANWQRYSVLGDYELYRRRE